MGIYGQSIQTFVALPREVANTLPAGGSIDGNGSPAVPEQVLEAINMGMRTIHTTWASPPSTEIMASIRQITVMSLQVYAMSEKIKSKHPVSASELRTALDMYKDVMDDFHVSISLSW